MTDLNLNKCLEQAATLAAKARPWIYANNGATYTAVFNQQEWVYDVFEDGVFLMKINMKSPAKAKAFLMSWLNN